MCGYPNNFIERSLTGVRFEDIEGLPSNKKKDSQHITQQYSTAQK